MDQFSNEDVRALCEAALSLKKLDLRGDRSSTNKALAGIFSLPNMEELDLFPYSAVEPVGDSTMLKEKLAHCYLKRLVC